MLGVREPDVYGADTLDDINEQLAGLAADLGAEVEFFQSNHEGELIDAVQKARGRCDAIMMNPGGYTHTSVALRDAVAAAGLPLAEVHLSNVHAREDFRKTSLFSDIATGTITGFGRHSYELGLRGLVAKLSAAG